VVHEHGYLSVLHLLDDPGTHRIGHFGTHRGRRRSRL
jgi:hypothetical protein